MYKIHPLLLLLTLSIPLTLFGQRASPEKSITASISPKASILLKNLQAGPMTNHSTSTPTDLTSEVPANRQMVFIAHLLIDLVDPGKKHKCDVLIEGQMVSLPSLTPFQTQSRWQWPTGRPPFRFAVGSYNCVSEPNIDRSGNPYYLTA